MARLEADIPMIRIWEGGPAETSGKTWDSIMIPERVASRCTIRVTDQDDSSYNCKLFREG